MADGPLTAAPNLTVTVDANGNLGVIGQTYAGPDRNATKFFNSRFRLAANNLLIVAFK